MQLQTGWAPAPEKRPAPALRARFDTPVRMCALSEAGGACLPSTCDSGRRGNARAQRSARRPIAASGQLHRRSSPLEGKGREAPRASPARAHAADTRVPHALAGPCAMDDPRLRRVRTRPERPLLDWTRVKETAAHWWHLVHKPWPSAAIDTTLDWERAKLVWKTRNVDPHAWSPLRCAWAAIGVRRASSCAWRAIHPSASPSSGSPSSRSSPPSGPSIRPTARSRPL